MERDPGLERRHEPDGDPSWEEVWDLDFWSADASLGGYIRLAVRPGQGRAVYWACLVGTDRPLVSVIEAEAPMPRPPTLEFRTSGLWADVIPQVPFSHMTVGLEAFGLAFDDPAEIFGRGWGDREALGFDLEWEDEMRPHVARSETSHQSSARVHGEILVGRDEIDFDGYGSRRHRWGAADAAADEVSAAGRFDDGTWFHLAAGADLVTGYVGDPDMPLAPAPSLTRTPDDLVAGGRIRVGDLYVAAEPLLHAPAIDSVDGGSVRSRRALVRWTAGDGRVGVGWLEDRSAA
ncbi:MAG: hypothetical protein AAF480_09285 [Actinomycetota bacterium]